MFPRYVPHLRCYAPTDGTLQGETAINMLREKRGLASAEFQLPVHVLKIMRNSQTATLVSSPDLFYRRKLKQLTSRSRPACQVCGDRPEEREDIGELDNACCACGLSKLCTRCSIGEGPYKECPRCIQSSFSRIGHREVSEQTRVWIKNVTALHGYCSLVSAGYWKRNTTVARSCARLRGKKLGT